MPRRGRAAEPYSREGHAESLPIPAPNKGLELTASSVRSSLASASGSSSGLAFGSSIAALILVCKNPWSASV
jgi:hypothetical protein